MAELYNYLDFNIFIETKNDSKRGEIVSKKEFRKLDYCNQEMVKKVGKAYFDFNGSLCAYNISQYEIVNTNEIRKTPYELHSEVVIEISQCSNKTNCITDKDRV